MGENFQTVFMEGGQLQISKASTSPYHISFSIESSQQSLEAKVVREAGGDSLSDTDRKIRDREVEEDWCADFARALAAAKSKKVNWRVFQNKKPGEEMVPIVEPKIEKFARPRMSASRRGRSLGD